MGLNLIKFFQLTLDHLFGINFLVECGYDMWFTSSAS